MARDDDLAEEHEAELAEKEKREKKEHKSKRQDETTFTNKPVKKESNRG